MNPPASVIDSKSLPASAPGVAHDLKAMICDLVARLCGERFGSTLAAVVLTGSLARDEATFLRDSDGWSVAGDAEFLAVFGDSTRLPQRTEIDDVIGSAMRLLKERAVRCEITIAGVRPSFLRRLAPHIFAYELRECGQVISGDRAILSLIPAFSAADIPREDAWRMLANRIVEQLEVVDELVDGRQVLSPRAHYQTVKLYLDMATSLSVFAGRYCPTYRGRASALASAATARSNHRWPFPLDDFLEKVGAATEWKLSATAPVTVGATFMRRAIAYARQLWRWELAQLTGLDETLPEQRLLQAWMVRQPLSARLRGWLFVLRERSVSGTWHGWPWQAVRVWSPSPRYRVYSAATTLLFSFADARRPMHLAPNHDWVAVARTLPVERHGSYSAGAPAWRGLADDILWNYHHFLTGTRA